MKKIILFTLPVLVLLAVFSFGQQINWTHGYDTSGNALTGKFDNLLKTGGTSYEMVFKMDDIYPWDFYPLQLDVQAALDSAESVYGNTGYWHYGTLWVQFKTQTSGDSVNCDIDLYEGVYGDANKTFANIKWDGTATKLADIGPGIVDVTQGIDVYAPDGKLLPAHVIKIVIDVDPAAAELDDSLDVYYEFAYPALLQQHKDYKPKTTE